MYLSTALALRGEIFRFAFFIALLTFNDLEKAIALNRHVALRIRMDRRLSLRHENPIFALYVSRQTDAGHCRQPQRAIGVPAIDVVLDLAAHRTTITTGPIPAIA
jgi:hypothetical protein